MVNNVHDVLDYLKFLPVLILLQLAFKVLLESEEVIVTYLLVDPLLQTRCGI